MQCPKCHSTINENDKFCPKCHKVLLLECPNCGALGESSVCEECGYSILVKCSKCSKINPTSNEKCASCGFPIATSIAYQECETDEFVAVVIEFENLKKIRKQLKSKALYSKFYNKLKNLLMTQVKKIEGKFIIYDDLFVLNFNKELSFVTASEKATRFALKILNIYTELNINVQKNFSLNLGLTVRLIKKNSDELLKKPTIVNNIKTLNVSKNKKKYLVGLQIILDQYVRDAVNKTYKTDSLYSVEVAGKMCMFYEVTLDSYVLEPDLVGSDEDEISAMQREIKREKKNTNKSRLNFKVFDINAKCHFLTSNAAVLTDKLKTLNFQKDAKILALKSSEALKADCLDVINFYKDLDYKVLFITYDEVMNYKPWHFFESIFKMYYKLPYNVKATSNVNVSNIPNVFIPLLEFCVEKPIVSGTSEDARYAYMELWGKFLSSLKDTVIIVDKFEYIDDTSLQTLEIFFDNKIINPNFVFITNPRNSLHSKIKKTLRLDTYTEIELQEAPISDCMNLFKNDAKEFINSYYYEKLEEVYDGSYLYFKIALEYLKESGVLIEFEDKTFIKDSISVILPNNLSDLYKARLKNLSKNSNISYICAYSTLLSSNLDLTVLDKLGMSNLNETIELLRKSGLVYLDNNLMIILNYTLIAKAFGGNLKQEIAKTFAQAIESNIGKYLNYISLAFLKEKMNLYKEAYDLFTKNAEFAMAVGDYDAYLKCYLKILTLLEKVENNITFEEIDNHKKNIYNNILMSLYSYAPAKIYSIEKLLLNDAFRNKDDDTIKQLSNLMLQGALISSSYTDAPVLLHNILTRMENPVLIANGEINIKFLLLTFVRIEVLFNVGQYRSCVEIACDILKVLNQDIIEAVKPAGFSFESFKQHVFESFRLVALAKIFLLDDDLEAFLDTIKNNIGEELPDKEVFLTLKSLFADEKRAVENVENYSPYSKIILLIILELTSEIKDYKSFAQNIYQAKLLADEIHQRDLKLFCELLIGYAYFKAGVQEKARAIFNDIINIGSSSSIFHIHVLGQYFLAIMEYENSNMEEALYIVNDVLFFIRKMENQAQFFFVIFEKLYMQIAKNQSIPSYDERHEFQKISHHKESMKIFIDEEIQ